jgi:hypothetical protein
MLTRILPALATALLFSIGAAAQTTDQSSATYPTPEGSLTVTTGQPGPRSYGPPPSFAQLSGGKAYISQSDADAGYDLLANDFIHADDNRDGRISQAEYDRWARSRN